MAAKGHRDRTDHRRPADQADIFVENFSPGVIDRLGLSSGPAPSGFGATHASTDVLSWRYPGLRRGRSR
jgi:hypothetical protein